MDYYSFERFSDWENMFTSKRKRRVRRKGNRLFAGKLWQSLSKKWVYYLPVIAFFGVILMTVFVGISFAWVARDLPSPDKIVRREGFTTKIYDRNDQLLYDVYQDAKRIPAELDNIPDYLKQATIAIEDKEFYSHPGFSIRGISRSIFRLILYRRISGGGSTLTQQLVKNVLLTTDQTFIRKYKELILTLQIERKYTKDEILRMYLNESPYGGTAWGVGAASEYYFGKDVSELGLVESAILAGLPQRPSAYSPFTSDLWQDRTMAVLRRMGEDGYISEEEESEVIETLDEVDFNDEKGVLKAPHFVMYVKQLLAEQFGEDQINIGGLKVTTTLDLELQEQTQEVVSQEVEKVEDLNITNGAAIVINPDNGEILSMVGSRDYFKDDFDGKFNVITQGLRQPGSSIKPVTYLAGFKQGYSPATMIMDVRTAFPVAGQKDYIPVNYDGNYNGPMQARYALASSINITAVKMLSMVGIKNMLSLANEMGISTLAPTKENLSKFGFSVTLGGGDVIPLELAIAYTSFANGGIKKEPVAILKVEDKDGRVLLERKGVEEKRILTTGEAFLINDILSDNNARALTFGLNSGLVVPGRKVAVKTGTTNDSRDNWAIGWTPNILVAAWVGNNDNSSMTTVASGISGATPIWRKIMIRSIDSLGYEEFSIPNDVTKIEVDKFSGYRSHDGFPAREEYFIKGREPNQNDPIHLKLKVCSSGGLATPPQVAGGDYEEKEFIAFKEEDPVSTDGKNRWQEGILAWISERDDPKYHPPSDYCKEGGTIEVAIESPANRSTVGNNFPIEAKTTSINKVIEVKVYVDDKEVNVLTSKPYEFDINLDDGTYVVKVVAKDTEGNTGERETEIGVNVPWDWQPSPTPTITPTSTPSPTPWPD